MKHLFRLGLIFSMSLPLFAEWNVVAMGKKHEDRADSFSDRPYGDDDVSYGVFAEIFEGMGGWRFGASYATDLTGPGGADSVITPEIGLLAIDGLYEAGISVLMDYVDSGDDAEWGDVYFQTQLGINLPVTKRLLLGIHAFYPFDDLSNLDLGELDYAVTLRMRF